MMKNRDQLQVALERYRYARSMWVEYDGQGDGYLRERAMDLAALVLADEVRHLLAQTSRDEE